MKIRKLSLPAKMLMILGSVPCISCGASEEWSRVKRFESARWQLHRQLYEAVGHEDSATFFHLLTQADQEALNLKDEDIGSGLLLKAAKQGDTEIVRMLLGRGIDVEARNRYMRCGYSSAVDVNTRTFEEGRNELTPLLATIPDGHIQTMKLLIHHRANINASLREKSALAWAKLLKHPDLVKLLKDVGAKE